MSVENFCNYDQLKAAILKRYNKQGNISGSFPGSDTEVRQGLRGNGNKGDAPVAKVDARVYFHGGGTGRGGSGADGQLPPCRNDSVVCERNPCTVAEVGQLANDFVQV